MSDSVYGVVYKITNIVNGKIYIGQTTQNLKVRLSQHLSPSSKYCILLHKAIKKYGRNSFKIEEIAKCYCLSELNDLEGFYIKQENSLSPNGYNLLIGGNNKRHHSSTKLKMSISRLGKHVKKLSLPRKAYSQEHKHNISLSKKGKNGLIGKKMEYRERENRYKRVYGASLTNDKTIVKFKCIKDASKFINQSHSNIVACLKKRKNSAGGYKWYYDKTKYKMKILILGHARHGKDTLAELIGKKTGLLHKSSSLAAAEIFIFDKLKNKYSYSSLSECFEDRVNHRKEWFDLIREYNKEDNLRLVKKILKESDIYVGLRSYEELLASKKQKIFNLIVGIFDPTKETEDKNSFDIDLFNECDVIIYSKNNKTALKKSINNLCKLISSNI
jgi:group I intron endonuclease